MLIFVVHSSISIYFVYNLQLIVFLKTLFFISIFIAEKLQTNQAVKRIFI